jgi:hypothetical protein
MKFESSGKNEGRWTENLEDDFVLADKGNAAPEDSGESAMNSDRAIQRPPLPFHKWKNGLRGSGDIYRALIRLNKEALRVIMEQVSI